MSYEIDNNTWSGDWTPKKKVPVQENIPCKSESCKGAPSGWTNSEVALIPTDVARELKCQTCGTVVLNIKPRLGTVTEESCLTPKAFKNYTLDI